MRKILNFFLIILASILIAGIYGILHDQITYTISYEYFTLFKFEQFSNAYYSQISNELFEWKENNSKIKSVKNVLNGSSYYEKFNDIMLSFKNLN